MVLLFDDMTLRRWDYAFSHLRGCDHFIARAVPNRVNVYGNEYYNI